MSLFGSLYTGVSALSAQSQSMGMIANNIANVSTTGYKRNSASFSSLVTSNGGGSSYTPGSVRANRIQNVDQQGALQQTASATDLGISGNGFFVVRKSPTGIQESLFTRSGDFKENSQGYLINSSGYYLMGWPLDEKGLLPASQADISSLQPVDVAFQGGFTKSTTNANLALNLKANEVQTPYPAYSVAPSTFSRGLRVYDTLGAAQDLSFSFTKSIAPTAHSASSIANLVRTDDLISKVPGLAAGDTFTVAVGTNTATTITVNNGDTVQNMLDNLNAVPGLEARLNDDGAILIQSSLPNQDITFANTSGMPATDLGFTARVGTTTTVANLTPTSDLVAAFTGMTVGDTMTVAVAGNPAVTITIRNNETVQDFLDDMNAITGVQASLTSTGTINVSAAVAGQSLVIADGTGTPATDMAINGTATASSVVLAPSLPDIFPGGTGSLAAAPNTQGWWKVDIKDPQGNILKSGFLNFNGDGSLNAIKDTDGEIKLTLQDIDWGNGSDPQDINIQIDRFTQYSGNYNVLFSDQNGAELGLRTGVEIDENGIVYARFSNGQSSALYKLPMATFTNENGLEEQSGVAYTETSNSGSYNLREANQGGAGEFQSGTLENSNVDLADEFSTMIITQRAYSAGTKIITTVDDMTEELLRLR